MYLTLQVVVLFNICAKHKDQLSVSIEFRFSFISTKSQQQPPQGTLISFFGVIHQQLNFV